MKQKTEGELDSKTFRIDLKSELNPISMIMKNLDPFVQITYKLKISKSKDEHGDYPYLLYKGETIIARGTFSQAESVPEIFCRYSPAIVFIENLKENGQTEMGS